jgi:hypothetical protein
MWPRPRCDPAVPPGRVAARLQAWDILVKDGDRYKLGTRRWELTRRPESELAVFRQIIDSVVPYRSAAEWMYY